MKTKIILITISLSLFCPWIINASAAQVTITRSGAAVSYFNSGYENYHLSSNYNGGIVLGEYLTSSQAVYEFYVPGNQQTSQLLTAIAFTIHGSGTITTLILNNTIINNVSGTYTRTLTGSDIYPLGSYGDPVNGDCVRVYIYVLYNFSPWINDRYDLEKIEFTYTYPGVNTTALEHYHTAYSGYNAIHGFRAKVIDQTWEIGNYQSDDVLKRAVQETGSLCQNILDFDGNIYDAIEAFFNALDNFHNLADLIYDGWEWIEFWGFYPTTGPTADQVKTACNEAATSCAELAEAYQSKGFDGTYTAQESADMLTKLQNASSKLTTLQNRLSSAAQDMQDRYTEGNNQAKVAKLSMGPLMRYADETLQLLDSYLPNLINDIQSQQAQFPPDTTPPTPTPMTWETDPYETSTSSISMTATAATDSFTPVHYEFDFVDSPTSGSGGDDRGWSTDRSHTDSGLGTNHQYGYRVRAKDSAPAQNTTGWSSVSYDYTDIETPSGATFGTITSTSIQVKSSNTPSGLTRGSSGLYIWASTGANSGWKQNNDYWTCSGLIPNYDTGFKIKARNGDGDETGYCSVVYKYTLANQPGTSSFSDITTNSIRANWTQNGNYYYTDYFCENTTTSQNSGWVNNTYSWNNTGLVGGTNYSFRVKARNSDGIETSWTDLGSATTIPSPPASINYPSNNSTGQYTVSWPLSTGATSYQLELSSNGGGSWSQIYSGANTSYSESICDGSYRYRVKANNTGGSSSWTTGTWDCVVNIPLPQVPASINYPSDSNSGQFTVNWPTSAGAVLYQLERSYNGGVNWNPVYSGSDTSYSEKIINGNYRYRVRASNDCVPSSWRIGDLNCFVVIGYPYAGSLKGWGVGDIPSGHFIDIAGGREHSLALKSDGSIVGWGANWSGQAAPPAGNNFIAIAAGSYYSLALKSDGSIVGWGNNDDGQATPPAGSDYVAIAAGAEHSLALKSNGSIVGWGWNYFGQATPPAGNDYVAIAAGGVHSLALKSDGSIVGWGQNWSGQATPPAGSDYVAISAGEDHSLALKSDGSIVGWGNNDDGQATPPAGSDYVAIAAGEFHSLALKSDGSIVGWGNNDFGQATPPDGNDYVAIAAGHLHSLALKSDGSIVGWGYLYHGQATPPAGSDYVAISAGYLHSLALKSDGSIVGWGDNEYGQATPPAGSDYVAIAAGWGHNIALKSDGSIAGWGNNWDGQATPPAGSDYVAIAAGWGHNIALKSDGSIAGWGNNWDGQATPPAGSDYVAISAGEDHSLALKSDGSIVGWGNNDDGQATPPAGSDYVAIAAGAVHNLALKSDGSIVGWGNNDFGQATPPAGSDYVAIAAGYSHSLALKSDGSIVGWGYNYDGQATPPAGNDYVAIAAGKIHSLAIISISGDFDGKSQEDLADYAIFASAWLSQPGQPNWNPACDISDPKDNIIDWKDLSVFTEDWLAGVEP